MVVFSTVYVAIYVAIVATTHMKDVTLGVTPWLQ